MKVSWGNLFAKRRKAHLLRTEFSWRMNWLFSPFTSKRFYFSTTDSGHGFSLTELMIVVGIISVLALFARAQFNVFLVKAGRAEGLPMLAKIYQSLEKYAHEEVGLITPGLAGSMAWYAGKSIENSGVETINCPPVVITSNLDTNFQFPISGCVKSRFYYWAILNISPGGQLTFSAHARSGYGAAGGPGQSGNPAFLRVICSPSYMAPVDYYKKASNINNGALTVVADYIRDC